MKSIKLWLFLVFLLSKTIQGCPTCIGHIEKNSPPFFSDEHYQPGQYREATRDDDDTDVENSENYLKEEEYE